MPEKCQGFFQFLKTHKNPKTPQTKLLNITNNTIGKK